MTSRERVMRALNFEDTDRVPKDLGGMLSTGISCFAYPGLVRALGLPPRRPRVHDTSQMLALPEMDVLDALGCDVVPVFQYWNVTAAFEQAERWFPYDFNGRLDARVLDPGAFKTQADGSIVQPAWNIRMPVDAYVFDAEHGGQPLDLSTDPPEPNLDALAATLEAGLLTREQVHETAELCRRVRNATDKAVFFNGPTAGIAISAYGGLGVFPLLCLIKPEFVKELHELVTDYVVRQLERLLPAVAPYIDIYISGCDDWGSQQQTFAPPAVFRELFQPYYRKVNDAVHAFAPEAKRFIHTCGAVYDVIDDIIDSGFDILNPVQWTAGGRSYRAWKDKCRGRIALWGGGVNTQGTLAYGSVEDVEREVREIVACLREDGGFVFNAIHNILAEVAPEKVVAMYRTAERAGAARAAT